MAPAVPADFRKARLLVDFNPFMIDPRNPVCSPLGFTV